MKLQVSLFFSLDMTSSEADFDLFYRAFMENSDGMDPEPEDINAKYNQEREDDKVIEDNLFHVLIITYELGECSAFKMKKKIIDSIKSVEQKMDISTRYDMMETETL